MDKANLRFIEKCAWWGVILSVPFFFILFSLQYDVCPSTNSSCITPYLGFIEPPGLVDGFPLTAIWILLAALYGFIVGGIIGFILNKKRTK